MSIVGSNRIPVLIIFNIPNTTQDINYRTIKFCLLCICVHFNIISHTFMHGSKQVQYRLIGSRNIITFPQFNHKHTFLITILMFWYMPHLTIRTATLSVGACRTSSQLTSVRVTAWIITCLLNSSKRCSTKYSILLLL